MGNTDFLDEANKVLGTYDKGLFTPEETISKLARIILLMGSVEVVDNEVETKISRGTL